MHIVKASTKEIKTIQQIVDNTWAATYAQILSTPQINYMINLLYSTQSLEESFANGNQYLIAYEGASALGFASFNAIEIAATYKMHKLYVLPATQGKGVGKLLLNYVVEDCKANGATALRLNVNKQNNAINFYKNNGFETIKEEIIDIGNGYVMDDYVMQKYI